MPDYGVTTEGFVAKTLDEIRTSLEEAVAAAYGLSTVDVQAASVFGQLIGIVSERLSEIWDVMQAVNANQDPDQAEGAALAALCALTGTVPREATNSTVTVTATGTPATPIATGKRGSVEGTGVLFETTEDGTIAALDDWTALTVYEIDDRVTNEDRVYLCTEGGTSAGSGGPDTTEEEITDGTVTWRYLGDGTGAVDIEAQAVETGPLVAASGTLNVIETPVSGWLGVINILDADPGQDEDTDSQLRMRREDELAGQSEATLEAIRATVLQVDDVTSCVVFQNVTNEEDGDGMPPKSVEALVLGGEDQDIRDALFASVAAGIETHGNTEGTTEDSQGITHEIKFSRPEEIEIYVEIDLIVDEETYPEDGDDQIKQAIVDWGDAQAAGKDAVAVAIAAQAIGITGVLDAWPTYIDTSPSPSTSDTIAISLRQRAVYDTSRITINRAGGSP